MSIQLPETTEGMSYEAIREHLADMYGLDVSLAKISLMTDKLHPLVASL